MQIFFLSTCPREAAKMACDKHVVKMIVETGQIISTIWFKVHQSRHALYYKLGWLVKPWKNFKHPSILWVEQSTANYTWTLDYWGALLEEYTNRYNKTHAYQALYNNIRTMMPDPSLCRDDFVPMTSEFQAVPVELKSDDPVATYRTLYKRDKARFAKWRYCDPPFWW